LLTQPEIDPQRIGVRGSSQGGALTLLVAQGIAMTTAVMSTQVTFSSDELDSLLRAALIFVAQKRFAQTITLLAVIQVWMAQSGYKPAPPLQTNVDRALTVAWSQLSEPIFAIAWETGQTMTPDQIVAFALTMGT
jgi:hypothetical protein